jgi:hypothetical protein
VKEAPCFDEIISAALKKGKNYKIIIIYNNHSEIRAPGQGRIPPPPTPFPGTPEKTSEPLEQINKTVCFSESLEFRHTRAFRKQSDF